MTKIILFLIIPLAIFSQVRLHDWNSSYYDKYNYSTFQSLDVIHQEIDKNNIDYELFNAAIFYCTNRQRVRHRKSPFIHSPALEKAAQGHSEDMFNYDFFSHTSKVRGKRSMADRLKKVGINYSYAAENIAYSNEKTPTYWSFALSIVDAWMGSKGHRKNILNNELHYLGCGAYLYQNLDSKNFFSVKSTQNFYSK